MSRSILFTVVYTNGRTNSFGMFDGHNVEFDKSKKFTSDQIANRIDRLSKSIGDKRFLRIEACVNISSGLSGLGSYYAKQQYATLSALYNDLRFQVSEVNQDIGEFERMSAFKIDKFYHATTRRKERCNDFNTAQKVSYLEQRYSVKNISKLSEFELLEAIAKKGVPTRVDYSIIHDLKNAVCEAI